MQLFWTNAEKTEGSKTFSFPNEPQKTVRGIPHNRQSQILVYKKNKKDCVEWNAQNTKVVFKAEKCSGQCPWVCKLPSE